MRLQLGVVNAAESHTLKPDLIVAVEQTVSKEPSPAILETPEAEAQEDVISVGRGRQDFERRTSTAIAETQPHLEEEAMRVHPIVELAETIPQMSTFTETQDVKAHLRNAAIEAAFVPTFGAPAPLSNISTVDSRPSFTFMAILLLACLFFLAMP